MISDLLTSFKKLLNLYFFANSRLYQACFLLSILLVSILLLIVSFNNENSLPTYITLTITLFSFTVTTGLSNIYEFVSSYYNFDELQDKNEKRKIAFIGTMENVILVSIILVGKLFPNILTLIIIIVIVISYIFFLIWAYLNSDLKVYKSNINTKKIESEIKNIITAKFKKERYKVNVYQNVKEIHVKINNDEIDISIKLKKNRIKDN